MDAREQRRPPAFTWTPWLFTFGVFWLLFAAYWGYAWVRDRDASDGLLALVWLTLGIFTVTLQVRARRRQRASRGRQ